MVNVEETNYCGYLCFYYLSFSQLIVRLLFSVLFFGGFHSTQRATQVERKCNRLGGIGFQMLAIKKSESDARNK